MNKPLLIPNKKAWKGLTVYCNQCKSDVSSICKKNGKPITKCAFGDKHNFKIYVHVPGTKNQRKTKTLETRDINEAIKEAIEFKKQVQLGISVNLTKTKELVEESEKKPQLILNVIAKYISVLVNENVPAHLRKERSKEHIKDVERALTVFASCLKKKGIDINSSTIQKVNPEIVGYIYEYLTEEKAFKQRTINKYIGYYVSWVNWYTKEYDRSMRNYFEEVPRPTPVTNPKSILFKEYQSLLPIITEQNGTKEYQTGKKRIRNLYRPWLKDAIRLGLETGRRREEIINLKFSDIIIDENGIGYIHVEDLKVNRAKGKKETDQKKFNEIPITKGLYQVLLDLGYENYKGSDNYILAPEMTSDRARPMADIMSKGFTHYFDQLETGKKLSFKSLRKTYITALELHTKGNARSVSGHSSDAVVNNHYLDKEVIAKNAAQEFSVFNIKDERELELSKIRNKEKTQIRQLEK